MELGTNANALIVEPGPTLHKAQITNPNVQTHDMLPANVKLSRLRFVFPPPVFSFVMFVLLCSVDSVTECTEGVESN